jgi:hypothetical protein
LAVTAPAPRFDHLLRMTDRRGTFEHACFAEPNPEYGYYTDDMARVLVVATREPDPERPLNGLAGVALRFLNQAQALDGACLQPLIAVAENPDITRALRDAKRELIPQIEHQKSAREPMNNRRLSATIRHPDTVELQL